MNEWGLVWMVPLKLLPTCVFVTTYVIGGRAHKWIRRYIGMPLFVLFCVALAKFDWKSISLLPLLLGVILGYGGDTLKEKFIRRLLYGASFGIAGLIIGFVFNKPLLGLFQLSISLQASLFLGLTNPDDAVDEEALIALLSVVLIPFIVS